MTRDEEKIQAAIAAAMKLPKEEEPEAPIFPTTPVNQMPSVEEAAPATEVPLVDESVPAQPVAPEGVAVSTDTQAAPEETDWAAVEKELNASLEKRGNKRKAKSVSVNVLACAVVVAGMASAVVWYQSSEGNKAKVADVMKDVKAMKNDLNPKQIVDSYKQSLDEIEAHQKKIQEAGSFEAGEGQAADGLQDATAQMNERVVPGQESEPAVPQTAPTMRIMPVNR